METWMAMFFGVIAMGAFLSWALSRVQRWADKRAARRRLRRVLRDMERGRGRVA